MWASVGVWWEWRLARQAGPEPGFGPPCASQMLSGHLPTWVLTPALAWGCRKGVPGECGQCRAVLCGLLKTALHAELRSLTLEASWVPFRGSEHDRRQCPGAFGD